MCLLENNNNIREHISDFLNYNCFLKKYILVIKSGKIYQTETAWLFYFSP